MPSGERHANSNQSLWHPFADMAAVKKDEFCVARAEGSWIWSTAGKRYLDATSSLWYSNIGHGHEAIAEVVSAQLRTLDAYSIFGDYGNPPANELANRLARLAPLDDPKVMLSSGGGDAIDTASKLARQHWTLRGQPSKTHLLSRAFAYHGSHGYGTSLGGIESYTSSVGPLMPATGLVQHDSAEALEEAIARIGADNVAAFFCEPVMGAGGVHPPPDGYMEQVAEICEQNNVLLIADSVICGFGRLGTWFGVERWDVHPDMIAFAKGVSGGFLPLGGLIVSKEIAEPYWSRPGGPVLRHGVTYAGHPTCCAAALAALDIYERAELIPRGRELEGDLKSALDSLVAHPFVSEVRAGLGLLGAVELDPSYLSSRPLAVEVLQRAVRAEGVLVRPLGTSLAVSPPLTITTSEISMIGEAIHAGLAHVEREGVST